MSFILYYGLSTQQEVVTHSRRICNVLGGGANNSALQLMVETCQQETLLGSLKERHPYRHGVGLPQLDPIGFDDVKQRTPRHVSEKIKKHFGINISQVQYRELAFAPFLSLLFCRLFYRLRTEEIPATVEGRAAYWKRHYNTIKGKGTVEKYIQNQKLIRVAY